MILTTAQTLTVAGILAAATIVLCWSIAGLIHRSGDWRAGRHAAPPDRPAPPPAPVPPAQDGGGRRRTTPDWREQVVPLGPDPVLVRPYVAHLAIGAGR